MSAALQPVETAMGYAVVTYAYDAQDRRISETYLDADGLNVTISAGYAGICLFFLFPLLNFRFTQAQCADSTLLARLPVLNSEKHSSTV